MGGVRDEIGPDLVRDLAEGGVVDVAGIRDRPAHDGLGPVRTGQGAHLLVVDEPALGVDAVADEVEPAAGEVRGRPVREVAAVRQTHRENGVSRAQQGGVRGQDGRTPGVGLHVGVIGAEQGLGAFHGDALGHVDDLAAAMVPGTGISLGVLVRERRAERRQHGRRGEVLGGDELQRRRLPLQLPEQDLGQLRILPAEHVDRQRTFKHVCDRHGGLRTSTGER